VKDTQVLNIKQGKNAFIYPHRIDGFFSSVEGYFHASFLILTLCALIKIYTRKETLQNV